MRRAVDKINNLNKSKNLIINKKTKFEKKKFKKFKEKHVKNILKKLAIPNSISDEKRRCLQPAGTRSGVDLQLILLPKTNFWRLFLNL